MSSPNGNLDNGDTLLLSNGIFSDFKTNYQSLIRLGYCFHHSKGRN